MVRSRLAAFVGTVSLIAGLALTAAQAQGPAAEELLDFPLGCLLMMSNIQGEGPDGLMAIESWSWGETNSGGRATGGGGGGKVQMQDFHFSKTVDKASPKLFLAVATGEHFKEAILTCRKAGGEQQEAYLTWKLSDVLVTSYQTAGHGEVVPTDSFSLNFSRIEYGYRPQNPDGTLGPPEKAGWDLKLNKKL